MGFLDRLLGPKLTETDLLAAAESGNEVAVRKAIKQGVNLNCIGNDDFTPLMAAEYGRRIGIFQMLIDAGADVNVKNRNGNTALLLSANVGQSEFVEALLNAGADISQTSKDGFTPLLLVVAKKNEDSDAHYRTLELIAPKVSVKERTLAAMLCTLNGNMRAAKRLIAIGIDPALTSAEGKVLRELAVECNRTEILNLLSGEDTPVTPAAPVSKPNHPNVVAEGMQRTETARYYVYSAPSRDIALKFLRDTQVREPFTYVVVETPDGALGRDAMMIYDESNNGALVEYGVREVLPEIAISDTHCAKCGHIVYPAAEEDIPESYARYFTITTLDEARKYGRGTRCTSCNALWCVFCHEPVDGQMQCPSCGSPLEFYSSREDVVTDYGRKKGYIS